MSLFGTTEELTMRLFYKVSGPSSKFVHEVIESSPDDVGMSFVMGIDASDEVKVEVASKVSELSEYVYYLACMLDRVQEERLSLQDRSESLDEQIGGLKHALVELRTELGEARALIKDLNLQTYRYRRDHGMF